MSKIYIVNEISSHIRIAIRFKHALAAEADLRLFFSNSASQARP